MILKGEMSMLNVLYLQESNVSTICAELQQKRDEAPQFFLQSPIIVDCLEMGESALLEFDFIALKKCLLDLGFIPVGVRNIPDNLNVTLLDSGWAVMRAKTTPTKSAATESVSAEPTAQAEQNDQQAQVQQAENPAPQPQIIKSVTIDRPVRSGQQVYAAEADMTVLAPTSAGSEVMADGSIHIYGPLRGRVLAGARGNESARIFCQSLQAELIAIAGRYQLLDESDTTLKGKPAMIRLEGEKLIIEALS